MGLSSELVNNNKFGFVHIKSGECRSGYNNDFKEMAKDIVRLYRVFKDIDGERYRDELDGIENEFGLMVPLKFVDDLKVEIEEVLRKGE